MTGRYETPRRLLISLEAEWGDVLGDSVDTSATEAGFLPCGARTAPFFHRAVDIVSRYLRPNSSLVDVGGATGRFCYELKSVARTVQAAIFDSSEIITKAAMLMRTSPDEFVEFVRKCHTAEVSRDYGWSDEQLRLLAERSALAQVDVLASFEPSPKVDVVVSLNVLDRVSNQQFFVEGLLSKLERPGILALACPFDYLDGNRGCADLRDLLPDDATVLHLSEEEYVVRVSARKVVTFVTQFLVARVG